MSFIQTFSHHSLTVPPSTVEYIVLLLRLGPLILLHQVMLDERVVYGQG